MITYTETNLITHFTLEHLLSYFRFKKMLYLSNPLKSFVTDIKIIEVRGRLVEGNQERKKGIMDLDQLRCECLVPTSFHLLFLVLLMVYPRPPLHFPSLVHQPNTGNTSSLRPYPYRQSHFCCCYRTPIWKRWCLSKRKKKYIIRSLSCLPQSYKRLEIFDWLILYMEMG